jgi:hypothetical protein
MNDYTMAPATTLLATSCACCSKPLLDADSVETGVGPECRRKHGYTKAQGIADWAGVIAVLAASDLWSNTSLVTTVQRAQSDNDARKASNALVHYIAAQQTGADVLVAVNCVRLLGYTTLADRMVKRLATVRIEVVSDRLLLKAPYSDAAVMAFRTIPGRVWDKTTKQTSFPIEQKRSVFEALKACFAGSIGFGPKGLFTLG